MLIWRSRKRVSRIWQPSTSIKHRWYIRWLFETSITKFFEMKIQLWNRSLKIFTSFTLEKIKILEILEVFHTSNDLMLCESLRINKSRQTNFLNKTSNFICSAGLNCQRVAFWPSYWKLVELHLKKNFEPIFATAPAATKNDTCPKSGRKWLENNHLAFLV